mgnify:CR=1 FL=1
MLNREKESHPTEGGLGTGETVRAVFVAVTTMCLAMMTVAVMIPPIAGFVGALFVLQEPHWPWMSVIPYGALCLMRPYINSGAWVVIMGSVLIWSASIFLMIICYRHLFWWT